jgi:coenzyme F420-reducing hydrogenase gamma subunit
VARHSVCLECKIAGNVCVSVAHGTPCLGPVTQAGCGALCPSFNRGCYGCFGPQDTPAMDAMDKVMVHHKMSARDRQRVLRSFNAGAPAFRDESQRHD